MMNRQGVRWCRIALLGATLAALLALDPPGATAQDAGAARVARVAGRVEILPVGQPTWVPATVGASLSVGAEIRAFEGGWAEIRLADGSSVVLAENSRLVVTRLESDAQSGRRASVFHLVVGKVRVAIAKAAITLIRFRESDFAITTPTAVAAARGTGWSTMHITFTTMVGHEDDFLCLDTLTGFLTPLGALMEATQCKLQRFVSRAYERFVYSTSFPDSKQLHDSLPNTRTPSTTDPSLGLIGGPLASLSPLFVNPTTFGNRGPELTSSPANLSETTSRRLR